MKKPFCRELYQKNDKIARELAKKAFQANYGYTLEDNPDIYGPDLIAFENGKFLGYVEVEIKQYWKEYAIHKFPAKSLHIPYRKSKFLNYKHKDIPDNIVFCVFSGDLKAGLWIDGEDLAECSFIEKDTVFTCREAFFDVPLSKMQYFEVEPLVYKRDNNESVKSQSS